jgi:hypothetical protein
MDNEFIKTPMGKRYLEVTMPALVESNNRVAKAQEEANTLMASIIKQKTRSMKLEQRKLLVEMKKAGLELQDLITEDTDPKLNS